VATLTSWPRGVARALAVLLVMVVLVGCQVKLQVDTKVNPDGSGAVTVSVGLDPAALAQVGDLQDQLKVGDLEAAGWKVTGPSKTSDGYTWVRASKPFADPAQAAAIMAEVNGADGAFRDWKVSRSSSAWSTVWKVDGTVDLRKGMATFSDPALDKALGANGLDDLVTQVEKREGKPVSDMVDVRVSVEVPGATHVYTPTLADRQTTAVAVSHAKTTGLAGTLALVGGVVLAALALVALILLRSRYARHHRDDRPAPRHAR
jgi:hypothetical protein